MDENTLSKFADLFAKTATTGNAQELQKEAAEHELLKEAISPASVLLPLGAAGAGGLAGYFGTDDKKRKLRNAMYGALTGGAAGLGGQLLWHGLSAGQNQPSQQQNNSQTIGVPAPAKSDAAAVSAGQHARTEPKTLPEKVLPESADDPRAALNTPRYVTDAFAGVYGARGANRLADALSRRLGLSGYSNLLKLNPKNFSGVADLIDSARRNPTTAPAEYLKPAPAKPRVFTEPQPQRPVPPVNRVGTSPKGNPSRNAAVPITDYLESLKKYYSDLADWTAKRTSSQAARDAYRKDFRAYRTEQPARARLVKQILGGRVDTSTPQKQLAAENVLAEMLEKSTGRRLNASKRRELGAGLNSARVNRSRGGRAATGLAGGVGVVLAADAVGSRLQNLVAEYLQNEAQPGSSPVVPYNEDRISQLVRALGLERK